MEEDLTEFHGKKIVNSDYQVLKAIEDTIGKDLSLYETGEDIKDYFGAIISNYQVKDLYLAG